MSDHAEQQPPAVDVSTVALNEDELEQVSGGAGYWTPIKDPGTGTEEPTIPITPILL